MSSRTWDCVWWAAVLVLVIAGVVIWGLPLLSAPEEGVDYNDVLFEAATSTGPMEADITTLDWEGCYTACITIATGNGNVEISWDANGVHVRGDIEAFDEAAQVFFLKKVRDYMQKYYDERNCPDIEKLCASGRICEVIGCHNIEWFSDSVCTSNPPQQQGKCRLCGKTCYREWE